MIETKKVSGYKHTQETINKIQETRKGWKHSEETKELYSKTRKGKKLGPCKSKYTRVDQLTMSGDYIMTWDCINDIIEKYPWCKVSEVCSGKRNSSHGYKWRYTI